MESERQISAIADLLKQVLFKPVLAEFQQHETYEKPEIYLKRIEYEYRQSF